MLYFILCVIFTTSGNCTPHILKKKQDLCLDPDPDREKEVKRIEKGKRKKITGKKIEVQRFLDDCPSSMVLIKL